MTGTLPRGFAPHFDSAYRQRRNNPEKLLELVALVEAEFRERFDLTEGSDDAIVCATLDISEQTASETAALRVIRLCIAVREHYARVGVAAHSEIGGWMGALQTAVHEADADRVLGAARHKINKTVGDARGKQVAAKAKTRAAKILDPRSRTGATCGRWAWPTMPSSR
ncbi:MAG TPA: hypothetical protein VIK97_16105 [Casimicrobiaceae bacterium]